MLVIEGKYFVVFFLMTPYSNNQHNPLSSAEGIRARNYTRPRWFVSVRWSSLCLRQPQSLC